MTGLVFSLFLVLPILIVYCSPTGDFLRVCFYANWNVRRPIPLYPKHIPPNLCTHIHYAYVDIQPNNYSLQLSMSEDFLPNGTGFVQQLNRLKGVNQKLKTLASVGGWTASMDLFNNITDPAQPTAMDAFVKAAPDLLRSWGFDGLDIHWFYPGAIDRGAKSYTKQGFTTLAKRLYEAFVSESLRTGRPRLLLSAAVSGKGDRIEDGYEIPEIARYFDYLELMAFDLKSEIEAKIRHPSALQPRLNEIGQSAEYNQEWAINKWLNEGAPKERLILGVPAFGRSYLLTDKSYNRPGDMFLGLGQPGNYTGEVGSLSYYEVCRMLKQNATSVWQRDNLAPYAYADRAWVAYENTQSIAYKMAYLKRRGLAGAMLWSLDLDDFSGQFCNEKTFPLANVIEAMLNSANTCTLQSFSRLILTLLFPYLLSLA